MIYLLKNKEKERVRMKKKYEALEVEIIRMNFADIITASGGTETPPVEDPIPGGNLFPGGFDKNGWTWSNQKRQLKKKGF